MLPSLKHVTYAIVAAGCGAGLLAARLNGAVSTPACDPDNAGLTLPSGFCASLVADGLGTARHLVAAPNGDVYVALRTARRSGHSGPPSIPTPSSW